MTKSSLNNVSRETSTILSGFEQLVSKWTKHINLIAPNSLHEIRERHTVDSAQLFQFAPKSTKHWVDLGSGGGFPGIVLAAIAKDQSPKTRFTLVESDQRKSTFLRAAIREFDLNATVISERIEEATPQHADVITARALSPLTQLLGQTMRHIAPTGRAIIPKGRNYNEEINDARKKWSFELTEVPSITATDARILIVEDIKRERP